MESGGDSFGSHRVGVESLERTARLLGSYLATKAEGEDEKVTRKEGGTVGASALRWVVGSGQCFNCGKGRLKPRPGIRVELA